MPIARSANNVQIIVLVVLSALAVSKALAFDVSSEKIFNVKKYGAVVGEQDDPDGEIADTNHEAFTRAFLAACHYKGKAAVVIPPGTYILGPTTFQGPCTNPNPLKVYIQGTLKALTDISLFPGQGQEWFNFEYLNGLIVTGGGVLDGQGASAWKYHDSKYSVDPSGQRLPASIQFFNVSNGIMGNITSINSKGFHIFIAMSTNITLYKIRINAPRNSPNTDGIHISKSNKIKVVHSVISTGDDCIGIIRGAYNISIKNVTCGPGHGISVGSLGKYEDESDVSRIFVKNCTFIGTTNGVRIKTRAGKNRIRATKLRFEDLVMRDVKRPIVINQLYETMKESIVKIKDVRFKNIRGTSLSKVAVDLVCSKVSPCEKIQLEDINLRYSGVETSNSQSLSSSCVNANVLYDGSQSPPPCH